MIAGDSMATSDQSRRIIQWDCGGGGPATAHIHACPGTPEASLHVSVIFPSCWDGRHLDSANHKSHMAYPRRHGRCPANHPVSLPQLTCCAPTSRTYSSAATAPVSASDRSCSPGGRRASGAPTSPVVTLIRAGRPYSTS